MPPEDTSSPNYNPEFTKCAAEAKGFKTVERVNIGVAVEVAEDLRVDHLSPT